MYILNRAICLFLCASIFYLSGTPMAIAQEIGFSERFALAENREAALAELIPGTDTYFYFHCLHCQTVGKIAEARKSDWPKRSQLDAQAQHQSARLKRSPFST